MSVEINVDSVSNLSIGLGVNVHMIMKSLCIHNVTIVLLDPL